MNDFTDSGVITIPITKKQMPVSMAQVRSQLTAVSNLEEDEDGVMLSETDQSMKVRMTLENNQNTSYIGKLSFGTPP